MFKRPAILELTNAGINEEVIWNVKNRQRVETALCKLKAIQQEDEEHVSYKDSGTVLTYSLMSLSESKLGDAS